MEVLHILTEHLTKFAQDFFVPGIILKVHLRLNLFTRSNVRIKTEFQENSLVCRRKTTFKLNVSKHQLMV